MLEVGMKAPDFTLLDKRGNSVSLSDFLGKKVVLYFYPKDNTPGCTRQACAFAQNHSNFEDKNVVVIGVSKDSVASHLKFAEKYDLPLCCYLTRSCRPFRPTVSGRRRSSTARQAWVWCAPPISSTSRV